MTAAPLRVLAIAGSARQGSFSKRLVDCMAAYAREAGADVTPVDLRALNLPVYDGDLELAAGPPAGAKTLRDLFAAHDALLFATPEYNGFPTPLEINAFDWLSRVPAEGTAPAGLAATAGKPVGLTSASPGPLGGLRSLNYLRQYLQMGFQMIVLPQQFALGGAGQAFDDSGALKDAKQQQAVRGVVAAMLGLATAVAARP